MIKLDSSSKSRNVDARYRVQSVGRALDILQFIASGGREGRRLTDIASEIQLSKAAAYSILQTLLAHGFVVHFGEGRTALYRLGMVLAQLGDLVVSNTDLADIALPALKQLTHKTGLTSRVAVMDQSYAVVVARVDAPGAIRFHAALGSRELPHSSAIGKAMLSALPAKDVEAILSRFELSSRTPQTLTNQAKLIQQIKLAAKNGYAVDEEEDVQGVVCIGAPILDRNGQLAGAISVTTLKQRDWASTKKSIAADVVDCATRISSQLTGLQKGSF